MSLESLSKYDENTAREILSAAASRVFKTWQAEPAEGVHDEAVASLIAELKDQIKLDRNDPGFDAALRARMSKEVTDTIMSGTHLDEITKRMGSVGRLPLSAYAIGFSNVFEDRKWESKSFIKKAIVGADYEHLLSKTTEVAGAETHQTVIVTPVKKNGKFHYWLLVDASRTGSSINIDFAYRVDPKKIDLSDAKSPLDVLEAFVNHYGFNIRFGQFYSGLLYRDVVIPGQELKFQVENGANEPFALRMTMVRLKPKSDELVHEYGTDEATLIIAAYAIDENKYRKDKLLIG